MVGLTVALMAACAKPRPPKTVVVVEKPKLKLAVLAVESDKFPKLAQAATDSLAKARVAGIDNIEVSKVSLEVVQLSIECVEQTPDCYEAVGKSLSANRLLFAQIVPGDGTTAIATTPAAKRRGKKNAPPPSHDVRVTITLFDVDAHTSQKTAEKVFPTETEATAGIDGLIAEATK